MEITKPDSEVASLEAPHDFRSPAKGKAFVFDKVVGCQDDINKLQCKLGKLDLDSILMDEGNISSPLLMSATKMKACQNISGQLPSIETLNDPWSHAKGRALVFDRMVGCHDDVNKLKCKFEELGFQCIMMDEENKITSLSMLESKMKACQNISEPLPAIVCFYGYGIEENLYLSEDFGESIPYKTFLKAIKRHMHKDSDMIVLTNICLKEAKNSKLASEFYKEPLKNVFHLCATTTEDESQCSLFTETLCEEFDNMKEKMDFLDFADHIINKIKSHQDTKYTLGTRYYGVCRHFRFDPPAKQNLEDLSKTTTVKGLEETQSASLKLRISSQKKEFERTELMCEKRGIREEKVFRSKKGKHSLKPVKPSQICVPHRGLLVQMLEHMFLPSLAKGAKKMRISDEDTSFSGEKVFGSIKSEHSN